MPILVSVIIPIHRIDQRLEKCLASLRALVAPPGGHEVILVTDGIAPGDWTSPDSPWTTIRTSGVGPARARNIGVAAAQGELLAFTDSDCVVAPDWLLELTRCLPQPDPHDGLAGVGGVQRSPDGDTAFGKQVQAFFEAISFVGGYARRHRNIREVSHNPSCNACYRRSAFEGVGGFDPGLWPGEDLDLDLRLRRARFRLVCNPQAVVGHHRPATLAGFARMMERYGRFSGGLLTRRHGVFRWFCLEPLLLLAIVALLIGLSAFHLAMGLMALVLLGAVAGLGFGLRTRSLMGSASCLLLLSVTLVAWNAGYLRGLIRMPTAPESAR